MEFYYIVDLRSPHVAQRPRRPPARGEHKTLLKFSSVSYQIAGRYFNIDLLPVYKVNR